MTSANKHRQRSKRSHSSAQAMAGSFAMTAKRKTSGQAAATARTPIMELLRKLFAKKQERS